MKQFTKVFLLVFAFFLEINLSANAQSESRSVLYKADNKFFSYTGRIDFSNPTLPKFWSSGVYISARFRGTFCIILLNDGATENANHNYVEIIIDNKKPFRVKLRGRSNTIKAAGGLTDGEHTITICKNTEAQVGYLEFVGMRCKTLLPPASPPLRKIEIIGGSETAGTGSDISQVACNAGKWYDQQNAWLSYGALTARLLKAEWHISAMSQVGLTHYNTLYDNINMVNGTISWDFAEYQPQVVTVLISEKKELIDSSDFVNAYENFLLKLRKYYPRADIICLNDPTGEPGTDENLQNHINTLVSLMNERDDHMVTKFFFSKQYAKGCDGNPSLAEHRQMAAELSAYIKKLKGW